MNPSRMQAVNFPPVISLACWIFVIAGGPSGMMPTSTILAWPPYEELSDEEKEYDRRTAMSLQWKARSKIVQVYLLTNSFVKGMS